MRRTFLGEMFFPRELFFADRKKTRKNLVSHGTTDTLLIWTVFMGGKYWTTLGPLGVCINGFVFTILQQYRLPSPCLPR